MRLNIYALKMRSAGLLWGSRREGINISGAVFSVEQANLKAPLSIRS